MKTLISAIITVLLLTGCETTAQLSNMYNNPQGAYSCEQIQAAFKAYEVDRQSTTALLQLSGMVTIPGATVEQAQENPGVYFQRAKAAANIALVAQGCQPI